MNKTLGTILLVIGTSIGGGMLALPAVTASSGFWRSSLLLLFAWAVMTFGALLMAEVNMWLHQDNNLISMTHKTLGKSASIIAWICYLGLMYALVSAYIAGGSGVTQSLFQSMHLHTPSWFNTILFTVVLGTILWHGIQSVDKVNRALMSVKLIAFVLLILLIARHIHPQNLAGGHAKYLFGATTVVITSFGFAGSIPTFCSYLDYDARKIRIAVITGSTVTLICYLIWIAAVQGSIARHLLIAMNSGDTTGALTQQLSNIAHHWIPIFAHLFTGICMLTSFLGVSLGLSDFLADGIKMKKSEHKPLIYGITFIPPLLITLFDPKIFISALSYAGIFCLILLALLPSLMVFTGRYRKKLAKGYQVWGGKKLVIMEIAIAAALVVLAIVQRIH